MKITRLRSDLYVIRERQNDYQQLNEKFVQLQSKVQLLKQAKDFTHDKGIYEIRVV